jgi:hypothetical protein
LLSAVPYGIAAGVFQVIEGVVLFEGGAGVVAAVMVTCADEPRLCGVEPAVDVDEPAGATST